MQKYLITIDIGTTSTKTLAFNLKGEILAKQNQFYDIINSQKDFLEQDPDTIFQAVKSGIRGISSSVGEGLMGVSFSSAMHSLILMDSEGNPLTNSIIWADNRSKNEAESLKNSSIGLELYLKTGTPIHPMSPLCKIEWFRKFRPDIYKKTEKFISIKEYIFFKFFNQYVIDFSIASATGMFNIYTRKWDKQALDYLGISEKKLSQPVPPSFYLKDLAPSVQNELKIDKGVAFVVGASDGCLANLGSNSIGTGSVSVTIGTSGAIRMACKSSKPDQQQRVFNYLLDEETFIVGGAINNGAIVLDWFKNNFYEVGTFEREQEFYEMLSANLCSIDPGSDGLLFLPYLLGERAPIWDSQAKGVFFGVSLQHTRVHFLRAIMEGVVYSLYSIAESLEELVNKIEVINAGGGFANSKFWVQMLADVFNKKVVINNSLESSSLGAAMVGFKALGIYNSFTEMQQLVDEVEEYFPNTENHKKYRKAYEIFKPLYGHLKEDFKKLK